jgi:isopropylmalate/homocitrate/citramalate synthase
VQQAEAMAAVPRAETARWIAQPANVAAMKSAGVDVDAVRRNMRIADAIRPLNEEIRRLAADSGNPESRKALLAKMQEVQTLQKQLVMDVRRPAGGPR